MPPPQGPQITLPHATRLLTTFTHFLTVSIHNILYYRNLYPPTTFLTSRAYNLPVHQSRHPAVCAWVRDALDAARDQIARGAVDRLALVVYGPDSSAAVMERWMFDLAQFPVWKVDGKKGKEKAWGPEDDDDEEAAAAAESKINWVNVDEQLRAAVRRLAYAGEKMTPLPEGCTFTIAVELRDEAEAPIGYPQPWVPTQPNLQTVSKDQPTPGKDVGGAKTTPLRAVEAGPLFFECWVEEGASKLEVPSTASSSPE